MPWCPECGAEYREGFTRCSECGVALVASPPPTDAPPPAPGPEWVRAGSYRTVEEASLARGALLEEGIPAEVVDRRVVMNPFPQVDEADVALLVAPEDAARAADVLARASSGADALADDADVGAEGEEDPTR